MKLWTISSRLRTGKRRIVSNGHLRAAKIVAARHHSLIGPGSGAAMFDCGVACGPAPQETSSVAFGIGSNISAGVSDLLVSQGRTTRQPAARCAQLPGCH